ncbi:MAG: hypothetical protein GX447_01120 [Elusimicrobia bacterium]|nr:hypothetical protein [Elusimicrobiota bacterium]
MKKIIIFALLSTPLFAADENNYAEAQSAAEAAAESAVSDEDAGVMVQDSDEDIKNIVEDYVKKDESLKGSFLVEDKISGKILKLKYLAVIESKNLNEESKKVKVQFNDPSSGKFRIVSFLLKGSNWGNIEIEKMELEPLVSAENKTDISKSGKKEIKTSVNSDKKSESKDKKSK